MKKSNKILLTAIICFFTIISLIGIALRMSVSRQGGMQMIEAGRGVIVKMPRYSAAPMQSPKTIPIKDFDKIAVSGIWAVKITQGKKYQVRLVMPKAVMGKVIVSKNDKILNLSERGMTQNSPVLAKITLPTLTKLTVAGMSSVKLSNFTADQFILNVFGMSSVKGIGGNIKQLKINCAGMSSIHFDHSSIINAAVSISGTGSAVLRNMKGGDLSGHLAGMSSLNYCGKVKTQNVSTEGMSSVHQVNCRFRQQY